MKVYVYVRMKFMERWQRKKKPSSQTSYYFPSLCALSHFCTPFMCWIGFFSMHLIWLDRFHAEYNKNSSSTSTTQILSANEYTIHIPLIYNSFGSTCFVYVCVCVCARMFESSSSYFSRCFKWTFAVEKVLFKVFGEVCQESKKKLRHSKGSERSHFHIFQIFRDFFFIYHIIYAECRHIYVNHKILR